MTKYLTINNLSKYRTELMGICILWIMLFHSEIPAPNNSILRALWYLFISFGGGFGVNIFLLLSGFGLMVSELMHPNKGQWSIWYKKRFVRILPAYFIVALICYSIYADSIEGVLYDTAFLNFLIDGNRQFWYIFAILFCYAIFPLVALMTCKIKPLIAISGLCLVVAAFCYAICYFAPDYYKKIEIFLTRIPCFLIGCYLAYIYKEHNTKIYHSLIGLATIVGTPMFIGLVNFSDSSRYSFDLLALPILFIFSIILNICIGDSKSHVINLLGSRSLEVYLIHVSFGFMIKSAFPDNFAIALTAYFVCSLILAELLYRISEFIKEKI